jgi:hypothetical protein
MRTKTFLLAFAAFAILSGIVGAQYDNSLSMVNLSVSPNPVMAGGNVTIRFQLYNAYESWLYGTSLQPSGSYPILNVSPLGSTVVGQLNPGLDPKYYNYTINVANTTPSGTYTVNFDANYFVYAALGTETASTMMPVTFYVNNKPEIEVVASSPQPSALYTGYNQTVDLMIENIGYGTARNVTVTIGSGQGINILSSVRSFFISNLTHGTSMTEPILISAKNLSRTYLTANTTYYSSRFQQRFSGSQNVNLSVAPSAQFTIGSTNSEEKVGATDVPVQFRLPNNGTTAAEQVQLTLQTTYPITPVASTAYVSDLQPGASTNVTFLVSVDTAGVPGNYPVTLYEQWKQPNGGTNQQFSGSNNYFVTVINGAAGGSTIEIVAAVIVIAIIVVVIARRRMAGSASKKAAAQKKEDKKK